MNPPARSNQRRFEKGDRPVWHLVFLAVAVVLVAISAFGYLLHIQRRVNSRITYTATSIREARHELMRQADRLAHHSSEMLFQHAPPELSSDSPVQIDDQAILQMRGGAYLLHLLHTAETVLGRIQDAHAVSQTFVARRNLSEQTWTRQSHALAILFADARTACRAAEGHQKLARARQISQMRARLPVEAASPELALFDSADPVALLVEFQVDLSELALTATELDDVVSRSAVDDVAGNQFRPTIERLRTRLTRLPEEVRLQVLPGDSLDQIQRLLLPADNRSDQARSLTELAIDHVEQAAERDRLDAEMDSAVADIRTVLNQIDSASNQLAAAAASAAETLAVRAWISLAAIGLGATVVLLCRGGRAASIVNGQLRHICIVNEELGLATRQAQAANQAKSDFLANMSHEIRTPMTAILGFSDLLKDPHLTPAERDLNLRSISRNGEQLLTIINDILDVTSLESGRLDMQPRPMCLRVELEELAGVFRVRALRKNLDLHLRLDPALPHSLLADPARVKQVVTNLLSNAIKFTDRGSIELVATAVGIDHAAGLCNLVIEVADTGPGIPPDRVPCLFLAFTQADATMSRRFGGTGLGLAICRKLVDLMNGRIEVESAPGVGSRFTVHLALPIVADATSSGGAPTTPDPALSRALPLAGRRILLVEDGIDNQRLISTLLRKAGAEITLADNGRIGLKAIEAAAAAGARFHMIFMDMQMPEMDGYQAAAALRERAYPAPVVALTAHAMDGDRERCLASGCDDYMTKPVSKQALIDMAVKWCSVVKADPASGTEPRMLQPAAA